MRRILCTVLLAAVSAVFVFAGGSSESGSGNTVDFVNDKMSQIEYSVRDTFEAAVKDASGIEMVISTYPDVASYQTTTQQSIATPRAPGLLTWWSGSQLEDLALSGNLADLTALWNETLIPQGVPASLMDPFTYDGKTYAVPYSVLYTSMYYSKAAFEKAGIEKVPETIEELMDACDKLLAVGITPIGIKDDTWAGFLWFQQILASYDPELYRGICEGTVKYTDERVKEAMQLWQEMNDRGYFSKIYDQADVRRMISSGEIGMNLEDNQNIRYLKQDYGMVPGEDFDLFIFPGREGQNPTIFMETTPLCVAEHSAQKELAMDVLKSWFTEPVQQAQYQGFGVFGNSTITIDDPVYNRLLGFTTAPDDYNVILRYYEYCPQDVRDTTLDAFMKFQMGNSTIDEMLETCQQAADEYWGAQN